MDQGADDFQRSIKETRQDIEETRASMTEKLELLEERVRGTVESATSTVEDIMESVKGTVGETVEVVKETVTDAKSTVEDIVENVKDTMDSTVTTVKQSFDVRYQTEQRPWLMFGGAVLVGYLVGGGLARKSTPESSARANARMSLSEDPMSSAWYNSAAMSAGSDTKELPPQYSQLPQPAARSGARSQFKEEFDILKGALIAVVMHSVREMVKENLPSVASQFGYAIDSATKKLGARPIAETPPHSQPKDRTATQAHVSEPGVRPAL
jgi:ElaB/YqjD/DUF883 family membrane-anchored ribosome-binding protein